MKPLPPYTVVPDTNALWGGKHPSVLKHSSFTKAFTECLESASIRLVVPEIVRSERVFQAVSAALVAVQNARANLETINLIATTEQNLPSPDELKGQAEARFDEWLDENDGTVAPIPYDKINWPQLVSDCVWRKPPFSTAAAEKPTEKGFRDSLILHSLVSIFEGRGDRNIIFISEDKLLREAATERVKSDTFSAYPRMSGFLDFLKLRLDEHAKEFVNGMLEKVPKIFNEYVFPLYNVAARIREGFSLRLAAPHLPKPEFGLGAKLGPSFYKFVSERFDVRSSRIDELPQKGRYSWKTIVSLREHFRNASAFGDAKWVVRISHFEVFWSAKVDRALTFGDISEPKILLLGQDKEYGLAAVLRHGLDLEEKSFAELWGTEIGLTDNSSEIEGDSSESSNSASSYDESSSE